MSDKKPGRGRGRGYRPSDASDPPPNPSPDIVANIVNQADSRTNTVAEGGESDVSAGSHSMTNTVDANSSVTDTAATDPTPTSSPDTTADTKNTNAEELIASIKNAHIQVETNATPLNPNSKEFVPQLYSNKQLNPTAPSFTPGGGSGNVRPQSRPIPGGLVTKHVPTSSSTSSDNMPLNISAPEFVPSGMVLPTSMQNGTIGIDSDESDGLEKKLQSFAPQEQEQELSILEPQHIVDGFDRVAVEDDGEREGQERLLMTVGEMLVKATMYPGSYDKLKLKMSSEIGKWPPTNSALSNLVEMLIFWGITVPSLRYMAGKIIQELNAELSGERASEYRKALMRRLQSWYNRNKEELVNTSSMSESEVFGFVNHTLFYAEVFYKIKVSNQPVKQLVSVMFEYIKKLLELKVDDTIVGACHILKLTGALLEDNNDTAMSEVLEILKKLAIDTSLSKKSTDLVVRVIQLQAKKWQNRQSVVATSASQSHQPEVQVKSKLNTAALPFIPSEEFEHHFQQPVRNPEEWKDFYSGDDEGLDIPDVGEDLAYDDEGLDPEIELEMEAFIEEIEEHLLMQDFDPELDHNKQ